MKLAVEPPRRPGRPASSDCHSNRARITCVVVYAVDRFARSLQDHVNLRARLALDGIRLLSATQPVGEGAVGQFVENSLANAAQLDNGIRAERTTAGMLAAVREGRWPWPAPLGYRNGTRADGTPTLVPDEHAAPLLRTAFEMVASRGYSKAEVLRQLTARGRPLAPQTFFRVLRNPLYAALITVPAWGVERQPGAFEAIVSVELFDRVQRALNDRRPSARSYLRNDPEFPLRRFVRCAVCNKPLTGSRSTGGSHKRHPYYRCHNPACRAVNTRKLDFELEFVDYLDRLGERRQYVRMFREIVREVWKTRIAETEKTRRALTRRVEELEGKRQRLLRAYSDRGAIDEEAYRAEDARLRAAVAEARAELLDIETDEVDVDALMDIAERVVSEPRLIWLDGDVEQRQRLQETIFPRGVTYSEDAGFGTADLCLFFRLLDAARDEKVQMASPAGFEPASPT